MGPVFAIVKKDLSQLLKSPSFYFLVGLCMVLWGLFFSFEVFSFVQRSFQLSTQLPDSGLNIHQSLISSYIILVHYILIFICSAMSVRFFTEEKKMKTLSLLLVSPMSSWQIVMGKWLVGLFILFALLAVSALFPLSLLFFMDLPLTLFFLSYLGVFVISSVYMGIGIFASSLSESLIVCVVLSLVSTVLLLLVSVGGQFTESLWLQEFFQFLSIDRHFSYFRKGILNLSSLTYFLSLSLFLAYLTERVIESHRWR